MDRKIISGHDHRWTTDELSLSETGLAGDTRQNRTFPGSGILLVYGNMSLLSGASCGTDCTKHMDLNGTLKEPYAPK